MPELQGNCNGSPFPLVNLSTYTDDLFGTFPFNFHKDFHFICPSSIAFLWHKIIHGRSKFGSQNTLQGRCAGTLKLDSVCWVWMWKKNGCRWLENGKRKCPWVWQFGGINEDRDKRVRQLGMKIWYKWLVAWKQQARRKLMRRKTPDKRVLGHRDQNYKIR